MNLSDVARSAGELIETAGIVIILVGLVVASVAAVRSGGPDWQTTYRNYRRRLGQAILLGLEFLVAGDIIRSVAVEPSLTSVGVLAIIVVIRTFLSMSLQLEIEGRWPWQRGASQPEGPAMAGSE
jgi:uncharacterized membrane protein